MGFLGDFGVGEGRYLVGKYIRPTARFQSCLVQI